MSDQCGDKAEYVAYIGIGRNKKTGYFWFGISPEYKEVKEEIDNLFSGNHEPTSTDGFVNIAPEKSESTPQENPVLGQFQDIISKFSRNMKAYNHLSFLSSTLFPIIEQAAIDGMVNDNIDKSFFEMHKEDGARILGVKSDGYRELQKLKKDIEEFYYARSTLPGAVLLSLVATFDSFISEFLRIILRNDKNKNRLMSRDIKVSEVLAMNSFDEVIDHLINDEIGRLMRGSHSDQVDFFEKNFSIKIRDTYDRWGHFIEIFERRNLVAHGDHVVNSTYLKNCDDHGLKGSTIKLGDKLEIDRDYLQGSAEILMEFGYFLVFTIWSKVFPEIKRDIYEFINSEAYEFIRSKNYDFAHRIILFAVNERNKDVPDGVRKRLKINLANCYRNLENMEKCEATLNSEDWSASSIEYKISVESVRGNIKEVIELMDLFSKFSNSSKILLREWPVFDWVRDEKDFQEKFLDIYGEEVVLVEDVKDEFLEETVH